jgi:hypothetical protein
MDWNQLVLLGSMLHQQGTPTAVHLLKEKTNLAITFGVDFAPVNGEAFSDNRLHLRYCLC